jgi:hypothetical protein
MKSWPKYPAIYEINAFVWLNELSGKYNSRITLANVPLKEWDSIASLSFDAVWLMGVWERSPAGRKIALSNSGLMSEFRNVLPDFSENDLAGSAYCIKNYVVDRMIGGPEGLAHARDMLARRGLRLILDFVPNHVAPDHWWVTSHPEYFVRGSDEDIKRDPSAFMKSGESIIALGKDPYFPAWPDVVQINAFSIELRKAVRNTMSEIAKQCDGVRCDMAMLVMNNIFLRTWGHRAGEKPAEDYWPLLIKAVKDKFPKFLFIAEAYWDLEWFLQQQGFDFCYDKKLYDRMEHKGAEEIRSHLHADMEYQDRLIRFIEDHDEPRAANTFHTEKEKMAAVALATLPGAKLFHEGQFEGRKVRVPVFLSRRPPETPDADLLNFHHNLLAQTGDNVFRNGNWQLCEVRGWSDNMSCSNIIAWTWRNDSSRYLIIINFSDFVSSGMLRLQWNDIYGKNLRLTDVLNGEKHDRSGSEMIGNGIYMELKPWSCHFFRMETFA